MMGRASSAIFCCLLYLAIGCRSQQPTIVQQQYFPQGRYVGRQWTLISRLQSLDGQPTGLLVTRNREGFMVYEPNQQTIDDWNQFPVLITAVDTPPSVPDDANGAPQTRMMDQTSDSEGHRFGVDGTQIVPDGYDPVLVDAEEANFNGNRRKKRDYSSRKFFADRQTRDTKEARLSRGLGHSRGKRSEGEEPSKGIIDKSINPVVKDEETRYRRGTDDNLRNLRFQYRYRRDADPKEPKITSSSMSYAGVEGRRKRRNARMSFGLPVLTGSFDV